MRAVNLIPAEQRSGASVGVGRSEGGAYAVLVLVGGLAALALIYGLAHHQIATRRAQAASVAAQAQRAETAAEQLAPYTSFIALREQRTQTVDTLVDSRFDWAHVFHEFGRVLPPQTSISSLSGTIAPAVAVAAAPAAATTAAPASSTSTAASASASSVASATPPGSVPTFTLTGCATSQPAVALTLERLRLIDGVNEVTLQSSTAGSAGGSTGGGGCPAHAPAFTAVIAFDPLPSATAVAAATKTVSDSPSSTSATPASTNAGVKAR
jgi:Tfp pilus assembly protein PilN